MRNILQVVPRKNSKEFREQLKAIFRFTDIKLARSAKNELTSSFMDQKRHEKACRY